MMYDNGDDNVRAKIKAAWKLAAPWALVFCYWWSLYSHWQPRAPDVFGCHTSLWSVATYCFPFNFPTVRFISFVKFLSIENKKAALSQWNYATPQSC